MTASERLRLRLTLLAATLVCAAGASAQEPHDTARAEARTHMAEGRAHRERQDLLAALASFSAADAIMNVPTTSLEVARTQLELGQLVEAEQTLRSLLARPTSADEPAPFARARAEAAGLLPEIEKRIPRLRFHVKDPEPGAQAQISVDGRAIPRELWQNGLALNPGAHHAVLESGGRRVERKVYLLEHDVETVRFELGARAVTKRKALRTAAAPKPAPLSAEESAPEEPSRAAIYALGGLSVAGLGAGALFGAIGKQRRSELARWCSPNCSEEVVGEVQQMYTLANVSFAVGAAAAGAAIVLYAVEPSAKEETPTASVRVRLAGYPGSAGMAVDGSF